MWFRLILSIALNKREYWSTWLPETAPAIFTCAKLCWLIHSDAVSDQWFDKLYRSTHCQLLCARFYFNRFLLRGFLLEFLIQFPRSFTTLWRVVYRCGNGWRSSSRSRGELAPAHCKAWAACRHLMALDYITAELANSWIMPDCIFSYVGCVCLLVSQLSSTDDDRIGLWERGFLQFILHCVLMKFS